jgi:hypothetical protein
VWRGGGSNERALHDVIEFIEDYIDGYGTLRRRFGVDMSTDWNTEADHQIPLHCGRQHVSIQCDIHLDLLWCGFAYTGFMKGLTLSGSK